MTKKVFVGLSGGVDSAVSAMLLKRQGFDVVGVFIKIWQPEFLECTWSADRMDAMRAAVALGIPFREIDLSLDYKKEVVEEMVSGYARGVTPNPDVLCNRHIKFGSFLKFAESEGADFVATGHYARIGESKRQKAPDLSARSAPTNRSPLRTKGKSFELLRGRDTNKDQSYFLYTLGQSDLARTLFPVGGLRKSEVRELALRARLPVAKKPDSQGLCFVGDVSMKEFLSRFMKLKKGAVLDMKGAVIGTHDGAQLYTVGQRHGFQITGAPSQNGFYVTGSNVKENTISVSENFRDAAKKCATLNSIHWIGAEPAFPLEAEVQTRYREVPIKSSISKSGGAITVSFQEPHIVSPGQSLVVYQGEKCLGGGVITG
ncbi:MAG: tRNA 2-thiouridine(34) synthase MnmA [bacterium]|nr:tRNA 2-thiouridine(34) synthase MnmA [bacterium]